MNLTLHLTENCNMDCSYCIRDKSCRDMSAETVDRAVELIFSSGRNAGLSFFGGEPLLKKDLIYRALEKSDALKLQTGKEFSCKMTTNGTLLEEDFLKVAKAHDMGIGLSFDGLIQDYCRKMSSGAGSIDVVTEKAKLLLEYLPKSYAMMTVAPKASEGIAESVMYLYGLGFRRINLTIAYGKRVHWADEDLQKVESQLAQVAEYYMECFGTDRFFFGPFDGKIRDVMGGKNPKERCHLGSRQLSVAVDGKLYACTQFIGDEEYCLGDVWSGISKEAAVRMTEKNNLRREPEDCIKCAIRERCTHTCGCTNRMETGDEDIVSAVTCNYEQMIIKIADRVGERISAEHPKTFEKLFGG